MNSASGFVDATGVIETEGNSCYDPRGTRVNSREQVTNDDIAFWVNKVLAPKYGLDNLNANNASSFLKEFEVNWVKMPVELKNKVMDLLVEQILSQNYDFKKALMDRMNLVDPSELVSGPSVGPGTDVLVGEGKEAFGAEGKSSFYYYASIVFSVSLVILGIVLYFRSKN